MQWLLSIDMMDMLTDLWCACWLRMDRQSSIVLLGIIIPRTYWIDSCCCWVNVVVHVHVPVHRGLDCWYWWQWWISQPCGGLVLGAMWNCVDVLLVHGANPDHKRWWIRYSSVSNITDITSYIVTVRMMHHLLILQRNVATQLLFPWW